VAHGDGWDAPSLDPTELAAGIGRLHDECAAAGRDPATLVISVRGLAADDLDADLLATYARLGVGHVGVTLPVASADAAVAALESLAARVPGYLPH
jgi:hypothetical protein